MEATYGPHTDRQCITILLTQNPSPCCSTGVSDTLHFIDTWLLGAFPWLGALCESLICPCGFYILLIVRTAIYWVPAPSNTQRAVGVTCSSLIGSRLIEETGRNLASCLFAFQGIGCLLHFSLRI